jgi:DNA-binding response OmpR family regulator
VGDVARTSAGSAPLALLIDDDDGMRTFVRVRLEADGFDVIEAASGEAGLDLLTPGVSVVLVDVGLPGIDGFTVVQTIRRSSRVPIVMMTGAGDEDDRVRGLELGADDYIVKPFLPREMTARIRAAARRSMPSEESWPEADVSPPDDGLVVNILVREARVAGKLLQLTAREFDLLAFLAAHPRQVFTRDQLLQQVWKSEPGWVGGGTVTEHIYRVRRELERHPASNASIVTVRGIGYRFQSTPADD